MSPNIQDWGVMSRTHVVEIALFILVGVLVSVWLSVDPPAQAPTRTSYLPAK